MAQEQTDFLELAHDDAIIEDQNDDNQDDINQDNDDNQNDDNDNQNDDNDNNDISEEQLSQATEDYQTALNLINEGDEDLAKEILEKYNGFAFDDKGNVLGEDGKVLTKSEDVIKDFASEEDIKYDDAGNVVNDEGEIIKTVNEVQAETIEANKIAKNLGYEFQDENGQLKVYSKGDTGIQEFAEDLAKFRMDTMLQEHYNSNPVLSEVAKHLIGGGDLDSFKAPVDYSSIETSGLTKEQKESYVAKSLIEEGVSKERAEKIAKNSKDLDEDTKEALNVLDKKDKEIRAERAEKIKQKEQQRQQEVQTYWQDVENTIKEGKLADISIPVNDKDAFYKYLSVPVENGQSKYAIESQKKTLKDTLQEAYYQFKGYSLKDIVKDNVNKSRVSSLRQKVREAEKRKSSDNSSGKRNRSKPFDITLDNIIE